MNLITLKTFDNAIEAHHLKNRLECEEISAYIFDENLVGLNPLYSQAIGGIKVKVAEQDFENASLIVREIEDLHYQLVDSKMINCPSCGSTNLYTDFKDFKSVKGILSFFTALLFFVYPIYYRNIHKCKDCANEFTVQ